MGLECRGDGSDGSRRPVFLHVRRQHLESSEPFHKHGSRLCIRRRPCGHAQRLHNALASSDVEDCLSILVCKHGEDGKTLGLDGGIPAVRSKRRDKDGKKPRLCEELRGAMARLCQELHDGDGIGGTSMKLGNDSG